MVASGPAENIVRGDVYLLAQPETILSRLDRYEGCSRSARPPGEYRRERLSVAMDDGRVVTSWAYFYRYPTRGFRSIRSGDYLHDRRR